MIIKRYIVNNMNEAMNRIRNELGNDAIIVSQRKIRQKGLLGFFKAKKLEVTAAVDEKKQPSVPKTIELEKEIIELKNLISSMNKQVDKKNEKKSESKNKFKSNLIKSGIPEEIVEEIVSEIKKRNEGKKLNQKIYEKEFKNILDEIIKINNIDNGKIHVFVGPTGVGKTTTIAKLASLYSLYKNKKVGLITIDTYRIGAIEQLKTYADILGVPFGVIYSNNEINSVLNEMTNCDIILIDTTGRNSKNYMQLQETKKLINEINPDNVHLVISMTTKEKDIKRIIEDYKILNYNSLILTKIDETNSMGSLVTAIYYSNTPISYITTGQNVPDDIEEAEKTKIINLILEAE
ncbi:flagellar biosynthesis protein FlhF [Thermobrachium celere]|uniref:Flagellar biosynthesis protein FlhF n=1 Tax=Thermobrachium celere DSM 8682 TaxID=941824 RepID=R7RRZ6_9CLOT|nr:flagellar biosynthesis protein FlhF [Thermobrachium celere]CDF58005.1 Flagellar biosynthesis protein FlhF [Thermobrachium celere DSM 8682]